MSLPEPASLARHVGRPSLRPRGHPLLDAEAVEQLATDVQRSPLIGHFTLPIDMEGISVQDPAQPVLCRKGGGKPPDSLFDVFG